MVKITLPFPSKFSEIRESTCGPGQAAAVELPANAVARGVCRREGVRGREDSLGGRAIPLPLSMGNRGANRRHGLAMAPAGLHASAGECGAGD